MVEVRLLFIRAPFSHENPWAYGVWETGASGYSYYLHGTLDAKASDLREVIETEERRDLLNRTS